jgi:hypothetical protein
VLVLAAPAGLAGPARLFVRRHDLAVGPDVAGTLRGVVRHVRSFGPSLRRNRPAATGGRQRRRRRRPYANALPDFSGVKNVEAGEASISCLLRREEASEHSAIVEASASTRTTVAAKPPPIAQAAEAQRADSGG